MYSALSESGNPMDSEPLVYVFPDDVQAALHLAGMWRDLSTKRRADTQPFTAGLSGGKTPSVFYDALAELPGMLQWENIHLFPVDERFVPGYHPESNRRLIEDHLMKPLGLTGDIMHPVMTENVSLEEAAARYERDLYEFFGSVSRIPRFDLIMLGIGDDGHTASLFPGTRELQELTRLAVPVKYQGAAHDRITMTLPLINNAANVVFFVTGERKASVIKDVLHRSNNEFPASRVSPMKGRLIFVLDNAAASGLDRDQTIIMGEK